MDVEKALLSRCVSGGLIESLVSRGVAGKHFENDTHREVFDMMVGHMSRYGVPPSREVVAAACPNFQPDIVTDSIDYLIDQFVKKVQRTEAKRAVLDIAQRIEVDADVNFDTLFMEYAERVAQSVPSSRVSRLSEVQDRIRRYYELQRTGRMPGVPFGLPTIDNIILGVQPHELVVISAPSSVGKSTMLQHNALAAYLADPSHRPVFITLEMEADALLRKFDAMAINFEYHALKALQLGEGDLRRWEEWGERAASAANDIIVIDDIDACTVDRVYAEILRWKPSAMFVDYFGIMTPSSHSKGDAWQGMAQMAKALKRVPRRTLTPVFTAAQTNRSGFKDGAKAENVADTIEIFRSADIMLGLERDEEESPNKMTVRILKNRDGPKGSTEVHLDLDRMDIYENTKFGRRTDKLAMPEPADLANNPFAAVKANPFVEV